MISELLKIDYEINDIYIELMKLEKKGELGSEEFLILIEMLKEQIAKEKKFLKDIRKEHRHIWDQAVSIIREDAMAISLRLKNYLDVYVTSNEKDKNDIIYNSCFNNVYLILGTFLQDAIKYFPQYRDKLLELKYFMALSSHEVEEVFVGNSFSFPRIVYTDLHIVADCLNIDYEELNAMILEFCASLVFEDIIPTLMGIKDEEYTDECSLVTSIHNQVMLRACLVLINNDNYDVFNESLYSLLEEYKECDNTVSYNVIDSIINDRMKDQKRVRVLSLKPMGE